MALVLFHGPFLEELRKINDQKITSQKGAYHHWMRLCEKISIVVSDSSYPAWLVCKLTCNGYVVDQSSCRCLCTTMLTCKHVQSVIGIESKILSHSVLSALFTLSMFNYVSTANNYWYNTVCTIH